MANKADPMPKHTGGTVQKTTAKPADANKPQANKNPIGVRQLNGNLLREEN